MSELPVLGLRVDGEPPPVLAPLVTGLSRWCEPRAVPREAPAAWLASSVRALPPGELPCAVLVGPVEELDDAGRATVVLAADEFGARAAGDRALLVRGSIDASRFRWMSPFVRARQRAWLELPDTLVASAGGDGPRPRALELELASAASVTGASELLPLLALGVPCVTDEPTAEDAGARDGVEVLVGEPGELEELALELAGDERRATSLSRAGRLLVEERHDVSRAARELALRLGLLRPAPGEALVRERLFELWAEPGDTIVQHALEALP